MATPIQSADYLQQVRGFGNKPIICAGAFTTGATGTPSIVSTSNADFRGLVTVARGTGSGELDNYTVSFPGSWGVTHAVLHSHNLTATINCTPVPSPSGGSVEFQFSGDFDDARLDFVLYCSADVI